MVTRAFIVSGVVTLLALSGCDSGDGGASSPPVTPAFPTAAPSDPQAVFERWKDIVSNPEKAQGSFLYADLAIELSGRDPALVGKMVDLLLDPATTLESRYLILRSLEFCHTPEIYPRLLDLTKPDVDPAIRTGIVIVLKSADDPAVAARMRELTTDPERRVRLAALLGLCEKGDKPSRATLLEYYFTDNLPPEHRAQIISTLALAPEAMDIKVFSVAVNDKSLADEPRMFSTGALGRIGDPAGIPPLQECIAGGNSPELTDAATTVAKVLQEKPAAGAATVDGTTK